MDPVLIIIVLGLVNGVLISYFNDGAVRRVVAAMGASLKKDTTRRKLNLEPPAFQPPGPSLFELIVSQVKAEPEGPLDYSRFPNIQGESTGVQFTPGLIDVLFFNPESEGDDWEKIVGAVRAVNSWQITDWRVLEQNTKDIRVASNVDKVLQNLTYEDITPEVESVFWSLAMKSHDYEAVKWGIAIGSISQTPDKIGDLMLFARHGEFTNYAVHALLREAEKDNTVLEKLVELLPFTGQWALITLINYIVTVQELIDRIDVQRDVLIYGMENNAGIPMEVAFTIAQAVQLETFFQEARKDARVFEAVVSLMDSLLTEPDPLGGIADLENWHPIYDAYVSLLAHHETDIRVLWALRSMEMFLDDEDLSWSRRASELMRVRKEFAERFSVEAVRKGLSDQDNRWMAFSLIEQRKITELLPEITDLFKIDHDFFTIRILGSIGDISHLELLLAAIPEIVDLEERAAIPLRSTHSPPSPQFNEEVKYSEIIRHLGKLGTNQALAQVLRAGEDFEPMIRAAACEAISSFPEEMITPAVKEVIENWLSDPMEYVAARARHHLLPLGLG